MESSAKEPSSSGSNASSNAGSTETQSSTSASNEVEFPLTVAPKTVSSNRDDSCTWYQGNRCYMPRDCYDCVNVAIQRDECAVDPNGMCVSMGKYRQHVAKQTNPRDPDFHGFFPSANFTYCPLSDDTCRKCKAGWRQHFWETGAVAQGETCQGADGCICISECERPNRAGVIVADQCSIFGGFGEQNNLVKGAYVGMAIFGVFTLALLIFKAFMKNRRAEARARVRREQREQRRTRQHRAGPALALTGWNSLRDKLLETEREFLEGDKPKLGQLGSAAAVPVTDAGEDVDAANESDEGRERRHA